MQAGRVKNDLHLWKASIMNTKKELSVGVIVITHSAKKHLQHCLPPLIASSVQPRVLLVNSSSHDGTVEEAERLGAETLVIPRVEFNHGTTREMARNYLRTDIVVMITPDAYPVGEDMLEKLVQPLLDGRASIAYARQLPHDGAGVFESFPREFNYPPESQLRGIEDAKKYGAYTFFCSNSCAAYVNAALDEIGGFRSVLTGEDTLAVSLLLQRGHKIAYVAEAEVKHSHEYTLMQEFKRYFDTGYYRKLNYELFRFQGNDEGRGREYLRALLKHLARVSPHLIPYAILQTAAKWAGYKLGRMSVNAPVWFLKRLSNQDFYWTSKDFIEAGRAVPVTQQIQGLGNPVRESMTVSS